MATSHPSGRLQKAAPDHRQQQQQQHHTSRAVSAPYLNDPVPRLPIPSHSSFSRLTNDDAVFLPPPPPIPAVSAYTHRAPSGDWSSRPGTPTSMYSGNGSRPVTPVTPQQGFAASPSMNTLPPMSAEKTKSKSWFSRTKDKKDSERGPGAWVYGHRDKLPFDVAAMMQGQPIQEIWDYTGDCLVYLYPKITRKGPAFRVDSSIFASSPILTKMAFGRLYSDSAMTDGDRQQMPMDDRMAGLSLQTPPATPRRNDRIFSQTSQSSRSTAESSEGSLREVHLYLDITLNGRPAPSPMSKKDLSNPLSEDAETLVDIRNFFAFLTGQSLVATEKRPTLFAIFMRLSELLRLYEFSNIDSSTYGEVATSSFTDYLEELAINDVRKSREKTIEGVILGERMRSVLLYNEAFTHAVGKHDDIVKLNSQKFRLLSPITVNRLGRAALDLDKRTASVRHILEDFDFPSIFSGIMNSKTADERKQVDFDAWRDAFLSMRKFFMGYQKHKYGSWPPKASSKKNDLETSGLNRLVLRDLYHDLSATYDILVDRSNLTNRTADGILMDERDADAPAARAIRHVLSEYDRSSPPVKPPIPFDLPIVPSLRSSRSDFGADAKKDAKAASKKLKDAEIITILRAASSNDVQPVPFVEAFRDFERKSAHGCTIKEIADLRVGQWIFLYAVLQALPLLVIDAPGIKYSNGVEYFLCEPPRSGVPWAREMSNTMKMNWYGIAGGSGGVVSLPSDVITHSIDGVFRRSHCWIAAEAWTRGNPILHAAVQEQQSVHEPSPTTSSARSGFSPSIPSNNRVSFGPGAPVMPALAVPRNSSPAGSANRRSVIDFGLEALPLPAGVMPDGITGDNGKMGGSRPGSMHAVDSTKTFDAILADSQVKGKKGRKK